MAGEKRSGRHANAGETRIDWSRTPVFAAVGADAELRGRVLSNLQARLAAKGLDLALLPAGEWHSPYALSLLARLHDLVIVDGESRLPLTGISIGERGAEAATDLLCNGPDENDVAELVERLMARLDDLVRQTPVWACVLIGGKSSRMGRPKHLIAGEDGRSWLERTLEILRPLVSGIVVSGQGDLPRPVADVIRLPDIPGVMGPLAGILSACRWQPEVSWLIVACDMPGITAGAVAWLLSGRRAGCWGRVPRLAGSDRCEPLLAWYDRRAARLFEEQLLAGNLRLREVASHPRVDNPVVPEPLRPAFANVNTLDELAVRSSDLI